MPIKTQDEVNWNFILAQLRAQRAILMIGPEMARTADDVALHTAVLREFDEESKKKMPYYNDDEFFFFRDPIAKTKAIFKVQQFYGQQQPTPIFEDLLRIPFHFVMSVSPDVMMRNLFKKYNLPHQFDYYKKYENPKDIKTPTIQYPQLYNLFGCIEDDESLIFTHEDLFEYLFAILGQRKLPHGIEGQLRSAKSFIFLGFKFDKWYVQLLLRLLGMHTGNYLRYASYTKDSLSCDTLNFSIDHFKIDFIDLSMRDFVKNLTERCADQGILRDLNAPAEQRTITEQVRELIQQDDLKGALLKLENYVDRLPDPDELMNDLITLIGSNTRLQRKVRNGVIRSEEAEVERNRLNQNVLSLTEVAEERTPK